MSKEPSENLTPNEMLQNVLAAVGGYPVEDAMAALTGALVYSARQVPLDYVIVEKTLKIAWKGIQPVADLHREAMRQKESMEGSE